VETEDSQTEGRSPGRPESNVVRIPRDWLGPREELVPFGVAADGRGNRAADGGSALRGPEAESVDGAAGSACPRPAASQLHLADPEPVPRAEDFWGEGSAAIQDAVQGPDETTAFRPNETTTFGQPQAQNRAIEDDGGAGQNVAHQVLADDTYVRDELDGVATDSASPTAAAASPSRRWRSVAALALFALLGAVIAVVTAAGHAGKPRPTSSRVAQHPATTALAPSAKKPTTRHAQAIRHTARLHRRSHRPHRPHSAATAHIAAVSHSSNSASQATSASGGGGGVAPAAASDSQSSGAGPATSTQSAAAAPAAAHNQPAGPTGAAAILGPGHCSC
jgi:hypothetical protein